MEEVHFPSRRITLLTLEEVESIMSETSQTIIPISGDCLEGAGVVDGGWVAVDFTKFPAPPRYKSKGGDGSIDLCLCYGVPPGRRGPIVMSKAYDGVWGNWQMVSTRYKNMWIGNQPRLNWGTRAERIFGVIFASWDQDGNLLWERDPGSFLDRLWTAPTIHGEVTPA